MVFSALLAAALIIAQGLAVWGFLRFVKSFGAYTASHERLAAALAATHESNLLLHREQIKVLEELRALRAPIVKEIVA